MVRAFLFSACLVCFAAGAVRADDMMTRKKLDDGLLAVLKEGTEVFNKGDQAGCFRLYQGALTVAWAALDGMPDQQMKIKEGLKKAEMQMRFSEKAFTLRKTIDDLRMDLAGSGKMMMKKPLWDRLGGEAAVNAVVDDFIGRAAANPKVNLTRKGTGMEWDPTPENVARVKKRLVQLVSMTTGGPLKYEGRDMKSAHKGMKITNDEFDALAGDLKATLDKFKVPMAEQKELLDIIGSTRKDIVEEK